MVVKNLVLYPDKPLNQKAEPVKNVGPALVKFAAEMMEVMEKWDGVGLAAPQVGVSLRIITLHNPETDENMCLVNPEILETEGQELGEEGCLSLPTIFAMVPRYTRIRVRALNEIGTEMNFEATGLLARIIQHEVDHLDGIVFIDRLDILTREAKLREWLEVREQDYSNASNS